MDSSFILKQSHLKTLRCQDFQRSVFLKDLRAFVFIFGDGFGVRFIKLQSGLNWDTNEFIKKQRLNVVGLAAVLDKVCFVGNCVRMKKNII